MRSHILKTTGILILILSFSCDKEINLMDIDGIPESIANYEAGLRIEAILYPAENTGLIRIDKTFSLDETSLYNCADENGNWNYYICYCENCPADGETFDTRKDCEKQCDITGTCELRLYKCTSNDSSYITIDECKEYCTQGFCVTDDLGEDGQKGDPYDEDNDFNFSEPSRGEGNGVPDCGEPHVDEYNEVLPFIHVTDCEEVKITAPDGQEHEFVYDSTAATLWAYPEYDPALDNAIHYDYGGYVPITEIDFNLSDSMAMADRIYSLYCDCGDYGTITAIDTLALPVSLYADSLGQESLYHNILNYETILNLLDTCVVDNFHFSTATDFGLATDNFFIFSPPDMRSFWVTAYEFNFNNIDIETCTLKHKNYIHGLPLFAREESVFGDSVNITSAVLAEIPGAFQYDVKTMSHSYENYFLYTALNLYDPMRSNLRDQDDQVIMGTFGSLTTTMLYSIVQPPFAVYFGEVDTVAGTIEIWIDAPIDVNALSSFTVTGVSLTGAYGGLIGDSSGWNISALGENPVYYTPPEDHYIPTGAEELLMIVTYDQLTDVRLCINNIAFNVSDDYTYEYIIFYGPCYEF